MPELMLDKNGELVGEDGKPFVVEGEPIKVSNAKRQEDVDFAFQAEKTKHKEMLDRLNQRIRAMEEQTSRTDGVQKLLDEAKREKTEMEARLADAEKAAESKVSQQLTTFKTKAQELEAALEQERTARVQDQVRTLLLGTAKDQFNDPVIDVVPHLLPLHRREAEKGPDGKDTGRFIDTFRLAYKGEDGKEITEDLPADKALEVWGQLHPHHLRAANRGGSGGGNYGPPNQNQKRSEMSVTDKVKFIQRHGQEAFEGLPA
jgi:hypothetical protein